VRRPGGPIIVGTLVVGADVIDARFSCDCAACRGACCSRGGDGPPLEPAEAAVLPGAAGAVARLLDGEAARIVAARGMVVRDAAGTFTIPLRENGACVCAVGGGPLRCAIETAFERGFSSVPKPVSCALYPVRIVRRPPFDVLVCDRWDICAPGRPAGAARGVRLLDFVRDGLVRAFGPATAEELSRLVSSRGS